MKERKSAINVSTENVVVRVQVGIEKILSVFKESCLFTFGRFVDLPGVDKIFVVSAFASRIRRLSIIHRCLKRKSTSSQNDLKNNQKFSWNAL